MSNQPRKIKYPKGQAPVAQIPTRKKSNNPQVNHKAKGKANKLKGDAYEALAVMHFNLIGLKSINKLVNEWIPIRGFPDGSIRARPGRKRPGDFYAVDPNGRSVLIEVKSSEVTTKAGNPRLQHSLIKEHQRERLIEHAEAGGLSLIAWPCNQEIRLYEYPNEHFGPNKSLTIHTPQFKPYWL